MSIAESVTFDIGVLKRSVLDGGESFLNASQISHYDVVTALLMYE